MSTARREGIELAFDIQGEGPDLLLIAGTASDRTLWAQIRAALSEHFRTIAFDNRDAGESTTTSENYAMLDLAKDALAVLDAAGATRWQEAGPALRFHIGLEAVDDLKADLAAGFERMRAT